MKQEKSELPRWFGSFLKAQRQHRGYSIRRLVEHGKTLKRPEGIPEPNVSMIRRLEEGTSRQFNLRSDEHLRFLADLYLTNAPLLYAAYSEPVPFYVHIKSGKGEEGFCSEIKDHEATGVTYYMSQYRLSDVAHTVSLMEIQPGGCGRVHSHEGIEFIWVIEGEIVVHLSGGIPPQEILVKSGELIHFRSTLKHFIRNPQQGKDDVARVLLIRVLSDN